MKTSFYPKLTRDELQLISDSLAIGAQKFYDRSTEAKDQTAKSKWGKKGNLALALAERFNNLLNL